jgi:hypothetical protein
MTRLKIYFEQPGPRTMGSVLGPNAAQQLYITQRRAFSHKSQKTRANSPATMATAVRSALRPNYATFKHRSIRGRLRSDALQFNTDFLQ